MVINNSTDTYSYSHYIVDQLDPGCPYQTIQAAVNAAMAVGGGIVLIRSGTYTEDLTLYNNVHLEGTGERRVTIEGTHAIPAVGRIDFENIVFQDPNAILLSAAIGTTLIFFHNCSFIIANGFIANLPNWTSLISFDSCDTDSTEDGIVNFTSSAEVYIINSTLGAGTTQTMLANDLVSIQQSIIHCPTFFTGSDVGTFIGDIFYRKMILSDNIVSSINNCIFDTGADPAIDASSTGLVSLSDVTINSAALTVIIGTGTVQFGSITYLNGKDIAPGITRDFTTRFETGELKLADATAGILHATAGVVSALADPLTVPHGGTGDATLTLHGILLGNAANAVQVTAEPANGQLPIGKTGDFPQLATLTPGPGIAIASGAGTITISAWGGGVSWAVYTIDQDLVVNNGFIANKAGLLTLRLPATAAIGDMIRVTGINTPVGWRISQRASQRIHWGTISTTVGVGGYIESTNIRDTVELLCVVAGASTEWQVLSTQGTFTWI
jgi:hypothetical protein